MRKLAKLIAIMSALSLLITMFAIPASADDEKIAYVVRYDDSGAAFVALQPVGEYNTLTYTLDESEPNINSAVYKGEIKVASRSMLRIAEFNENGKKVKAIKMTVTPRVATPTYTETYVDGKLCVTISCDTLGAKIYYTTNGSVPTKDSKRVTGRLILSGKTTIKAFATYSGLRDSAKMIATLTPDPNGGLAALSEPVISSTPSTPQIDNDAFDTESDDDIDAPAADTSKTETTKTETVKAKKGSDYDISSIKKEINSTLAYMNESGSVTVTLTPKAVTNKIYYTTDGTKPTKYDKLYEKRIKLSEEKTLRAIEYNAKGDIVAYLSTKVKMKCIPPKFVCTGISGNMWTIEMSTATEGADIYFVTDSSAPNKTTSMKYTTPIIVSAATKIRAIAVKDGYRDSIIEDNYAKFVVLDTNEYDKSRDSVTHEAAVAVNDYRAKCGLSALKESDILTQAAYLRAKELQYDYSHRRPRGANGPTVISEFTENYFTANEHVDYNVSSVSNMVFAASQSYDKYPFYNYVGRDYNSIGAAKYTSKNGRTYYVILVASLP